MPAARAASRVNVLSLASKRVWARGARSPANAQRMRSVPIQLCPLDCSVTSRVRSASSPTRSAGTSASAAPARLAAANRLLTSLVRARNGPPDIGASMHSEAPLTQSSRYALDIARRDCRAQHHCAAGSQTARSPVLPEQHGVALRRIVNDHDKQFDFARQRGGFRRRNAGARADNNRLGVRPQVAHRSSAVPVPGPCFRYRSRRWRRPCSRRATQLCINVRLRAIDISSPRPRPNVTIAVPP